MADTLHPYPADFVSPVKVIVNHLRGVELVPYVELGHAAWHLAGYALSHVDPHPPVRAADYKGLSDAELADKLEALAVPQAQAVDWAGFLLLALEILRRLFLGA
jgi:hypothetical protein